MSAFLEIYTKQELIDKVKAIDADLAVALKRSELDTTTDQQEFELDQKVLKEQRDYYFELLKQKCMDEDEGGGIITLEPRGGPIV